MISDKDKLALYAASSGILLLMVVMLWFSIRVENAKRSAATPMPTGRPYTDAAGDVPYERVRYAEDVSSALTRYETELTRLGGLLIRYELDAGVSLDSDWVTELHGAAYSLGTIGFFTRHLTTPSGMEPLERSLLAVEKEITSAAGIIENKASYNYADIASIMLHLDKATDRMEAFVRLMKSRNWADPAEDHAANNNQARSIGVRTTVIPTATITPTLGANLSRSDRIFPIPTPTPSYLVTSWFGSGEERCQLGPDAVYTVHNRAKTEGVEYILISTSDGCEGWMREP